MYKFLLIGLTCISLISCKKREEVIAPKPEPQQPKSIVYRTLNQRLKASDLKPFNLDMDGDGTVELSFFVQMVFMGGKTHLFSGVNPVLYGQICANDPNDEVFLNMGDVHSFEPKNAIGTKGKWVDYHAMLCDQIDESDGSKTYKGYWANGNPHYMAVRIVKNGNVNYGWIRVQFDKKSQELLFIDAAWNKTNGEQILAGEY